MATLLTELGDFSAPAADGLWVAAADAERATGWDLKPEGMCRDDICVPLAPTAVHGDRVDLASFWAGQGGVVLSDAARDVWVLGAGADDRNRTLAGLEAPDFELPDLGGKPQRLSM